MGKVGGVLTGLRLASHARVIIADDDVRYDEAALNRLAAALDAAEVVRPQNYFDPLPWHACWDTGRILLNRVTGGDWPGTIAVRRCVLIATGGYDGRAMFENLELVRTVVAAGGREARLDDRLRVAAAAVARVISGRNACGRRTTSSRGPAASPFSSPCCRRSRSSPRPAVGARSPQAPSRSCWPPKRGGRGTAGRASFPYAPSFFSLAWLAERAVCSWLAVGARVILGGVPYRGRILRHAATPMRVLRARHSARLLEAGVSSRAHDRHGAGHRSA